MALSPNDRKAIELWTGDLTEDQAAEADVRLQVLGHTGVVAYEILRIRLSNMLGNPDELRLEGDARVRWVQAKAVAQGSLEGLYDWFGELDPAPVLNAAASAVMATGTVAGGRTKVRAVAYTMSNPRP